MSPELPNKAEERLQRYARKRREEAGDLSMGPATRRRLHAEIESRFSRSGKTGAGWLERLVSARFRLLGAAAAAAVVMIAAITSWNSNRTHVPAAQPAHPMKMASLDARPEELPERPPEPEHLFFDQERVLGEAELSKRLGTRRAGAPAEPGSPAATAAGPKAGSDFSDRITMESVDEGAVAFRWFGAEPAPAPIAPPIAEERSLSDDASVSYSAPGKARVLSLTSAPATGLPPSDETVALSDRLARSSSTAAASNGVLTRELAGGPRPAPVLAPKVSDYSILPRKAEGESGAIDEAQLATSPLIAGRGGAQNAPAPGAPAPQLAPPAPSRSRAVAHAPAATPRAEGGARDLGERVLPQDSIRAQTNLVANSSQYFRRGAVDLSKQKVQADALHELSAVKQDAASAVLNNFTIEQSGKVVRFVDEDGSVYSGTADPPAEFGFGNNDPAVAAGAAQALRETDRSNVSAGVPVSFTVRGTNRTLRQIVVVKGQFTQAAPDAAVLQRGVQTAQTASAGFGSTSATQFGASGQLPVPAQSAETRLGEELRLKKAAEMKRQDESATDKLNDAEVVEGTVQVGDAPLQRFKATRLTR